MITIIAAISDNLALGEKGDLIYHIPEDLKRFKRKTYGHPMVMGRRTFESLPGLLPGRLHIVVSSKPLEDSENVKWFDNLDKAIDFAKNIDNKVFIIGGGNVFEQTIDIADILDLTFIHETFQGDTFFPKIDLDKWKLTNSEIGNDKNHKITYKTYIKL